MSARLALTSFARDDVAAARRWYDERRAGLGDEFAADFYRALAVIESHPTAQTLVDPVFRKRKLQRFPYAVYFECSVTAILVIAVVHRRRSDKFIAEQLTRR